MIRDTLLYVLFGAGLLGCLFMLVAACIVPSFARRPPVPTRDWPGVSILKPLHGDEIGLFESLVTFCKLDYPGPVQIVFGVTNPTDPAIAVVRRLQAAFPGKAIALVADARIVGPNPKVANLINMSGRVAHDIVIVADSDIQVASDYLTQIVSALDRQQGGAVTCPYYGLSIDSVWSRLSRLSIDGHFLPGVLTGVRFKLSRPCLGSTIALRRSSLAVIGGFEAVADCLADDYALGEALARLRQDVGQTEPVRRRVDQLGAFDQRRRLREPGRIPERAHLAPHLVAGAGAAVEALEGRGLQEQRPHHDEGDLRSDISRPWGMSR